MGWTYKIFGLVLMHVPSHAGRVSVVSASSCCTAVPGSNPARHPSLGSARENPGAEKYRSRFFPAQQQEIPAQQQAYQPITKDEYCINTVERKLEK